MTDLQEKTDSQETDDPHKYLRMQFKHRNSGNRYRLFGIHERTPLSDGKRHYKVWIADDSGVVITTTWANLLNLFALVVPRELESKE